MLTTGVRFYFRVGISKLYVAVLMLLSFAVPVGLAQRAPDAGYGAMLLCRPVLIVSDDEDPDTVIRSSAAAKQARAELARSLQVFGFRAIDEDQWISGIAIPDRSSTADVLMHAEFARRMPPYVEHVAVLRTQAWVEESSKSGFFGALRIQIEVEVHDLVSQGLLAHSQEAESFILSRNCMSSRPCLNDVLANGATEVGFVIGSMVGSSLDRQWKERDGSTEGAVAPTVGGGSATCYTLTLRYFENSEALEILETMAEESASYRYHERIEASGTSEKKYFYVSTSRAAKLEERLAIALKDRGVDIDREISMERDGTDLRITRIMAPGSQSN